MPELPSIATIIASTSPTAQGMFNALSPMAYFEIGIALAVIIILLIIGVVKSGVGKLTSGTVMQTGGERDIVLERTRQMNHLN